MARKDCGGREAATTFLAYGVCQEELWNTLAEYCKPSFHNRILDADPTMTGDDENYESSHTTQKSGESIDVTPDSRLLAYHHRYVGGDDDCPQRIAADSLQSDATRLSAMSTERQP